MNLFANIKTFAADESGAVTVDWVVLTAAIVGLGIAVITAVRGGVNNLGAEINRSLTEGAALTNVRDQLNPPPPPQ
ncbi:MAG: Flp family type IVb pilin [Roseinatronobacter sp.]